MASVSNTIWKFSTSLIQSYLPLDFYLQVFQINSCTKIEVHHRTATGVTKSVPQIKNLTNITIIRIRPPFLCLFDKTLTTYIYLRYPDFKSSVANHFTFCLKCRMNCARKLNNFRGESVEDLLPSYYHYLQFAYFKRKKKKISPHKTRWWCHMSLFG